MSKEAFPSSQYFCIVIRLFCSCITNSKIQCLLKSVGSWQSKEEWHSLLYRLQCCFLRGLTLLLSFIIIFTVISILAMVAPSLCRGCSEKPWLAALLFFSVEVGKSRIPAKRRVEINDGIFYNPIVEEEFLSGRISKWNPCTCFNYIISSVLYLEGAIHWT